MYGVMMPCVSAGSNQVGASETCMPQVSCPCGAAARAMPGAAGGQPQGRGAAEHVAPRHPVSGVFPGRIG